MAGTPTPNYNFPTYAETDVPDLAGAYNQAVNAIDAKIKEVADTIPSDVDVPDANSTTKGIAKLYDSTTVGDGTQDDGGITPKAVKDYVDAKVPTEQQTYTGTAPIVVNNRTHAISVSDTRGWGYSSSEYTPGTPGTVVGVNTDAFNNYMSTGTDPEDGWGGFAVPSVGAVRGAIISRTPDASTSAKGLVQFAAAYSGANTTQAATGGTIAEALSLFLNNWADIANAATTPLTTEMLANLYVTPSGIVVYKAPTE